MHPQLGVLAVGKKELRGEIPCAPEIHETRVMKRENVQRRPPDNSVSAG